MRAVASNAWLLARLVCADLRLVCRTMLGYLGVDSLRRVTLSHVAAWLVILVLGPPVWITLSLRARWPSSKEVSGGDDS